MMRALRIMASLVWTLFALPITCAQSGNDLYTGGVSPSGPGGRINPAEPFITNGGDGGAGGGR